MLGALAIIGALAATAPVPPAPARWVEDAGGFLSNDRRAALDARLEAYEHATGHQVVVWIGKSLGGAPLDDFAVRTFAAWKVGRKGLDDGLVMFVLSADRTIDIEVGYGLEAVVPDAVAKRIIDDVMVPRLRTGEHDAAIEGGVDAILAAIEGHPWDGHRATEPTGPSTLELVGGGIFLVLVVIFAITHPRAFLWFLLFAVGRGGGGSGGGGGRFGGGGRSGGGGARGGW
jgi:uncharacterized protein